MRVSRLIVAAILMPIASLCAYFIALHWNGDRGVIDSNGSAIGVLVILGSVLGISRVASDQGWNERAGIAITLACAYFMLTWSVFADLAVSPDDSPHLVWFGLCVAAFTPTVVIIPASKMAWHAYRSRRFGDSELS
jgi:hypothetical protein